MVSRMLWSFNGIFFILLSVYYFVMRKHYNLLRLIFENFMLVIFAFFDLVEIFILVLFFGHYLFKREEDVHSFWMFSFNLINGYLLILFGRYGNTLTYCFALFTCFMQCCCVYVEKRLITYQKRMEKEQFIHRKLHELDNLKIAQGLFAQHQDKPVNVRDLNQLLKEYYQLLNQMKLSVKWVVEEIDLPFTLAEAVCLFANLLKNGVIHSQHRFSFQCCQQQGQIIIIVKNDRTSSNVKSHGYGTQVIKEIISAYQGEYVEIQNEEEFITMICLGGNVDGINGLDV